jgi:flagellar motor switch protein FliM
VLISFELTIGDARGMMNLCIPFNSIERIGGKLTSNSWVTYSRKPASAESIAMMSERLKGSVVELVVQLAETKITMNDLIGLRVGDIITTEKDVATPMQVIVQGHAKFGAFPGAYKGHKAIQVGEQIAARDAELAGEE